MFAEDKTAHRAGINDIKPALENAPLSATRTATGKPEADGLADGTLGVFTV